MRVRPGRLLPSVIVGGLLASGLALGAGTASAVDWTDGQACKVGLVAGVVKGDNCVVKLTGIVLGPLSDATAVVSGAASSVVPESAKPLPDTVDEVVKPPTSEVPKSDPAPAPKNTKSTVPAGSGAPDSRSAAPAAGPAPAPLVAAPAGGAAGPLGALSPAAFGGIAPAGLASSLFGANSYDPGLLFGSPLGGAAAQLFSPKADSSVTTVSQAQVLAAPGRGYGTPATIGVIILACLIGFAVRHRVISRMKARDLAEGNDTPHAGPEAEQIDDDEARTTVLAR